MLKVEATELEAIELRREVKDKKLEALNMLVEEAFDALEEALVLV